MWIFQVLTFILTCWEENSMTSFFSFLLFSLHFRHSLSSQIVGSSWVRQSQKRCELMFSEHFFDKRGVIHSHFVVSCHCLFSNNLTMNWMIWSSVMNRLDILIKIKQEFWWVSWLLMSLSFKAVSLKKLLRYNAAKTTNKNNKHKHKHKQKEMLQIFVII